MEIFFLSANVFLTSVAFVSQIIFSGKIQVVWPWICSIRYPDNSGNEMHFLAPSSLSGHFPRIGTTSCSIYLVFTKENSFFQFSEIHSHYVFVLLLFSWTSSQYKRSQRGKQKKQICSRWVHPFSVSISLSMSKFCTMQKPQQHAAVRPTLCLAYGTSIYWRERERRKWEFCQAMSSGIYYMQWAEK